MKSWRFGARAAGRRLLGAGWSKPEPEWTWTDGSRAELRLPAQPGEGDLYVTLTATPFVRDAHKWQRFAIEAGGETIARFEVDRIFSRGFRVPRRLAQDGIIQVFILLSNARRGHELGVDDNRELGLCLHQLHAEPIPAAKPAAIAPITLAALERLWRAQNLPAPFPGCTPLVALGDTLGEHWRRGDLEAASSLAGALAPTLPRLEFTLSPHEDCAEVRATLEADGSLTIGIAATIGQVEVGARQLVGWRLIPLLPLLAAYAESRRLPGTMALNCGDDPHTPGIGFCGRGSEVLLIPDPYFLGSEAYRSLHETYAREAKPFRDRKRVAFWRGSTTGHRTGPTLESFPRVALCRLARTPEALPWFDTGLTDAAGLSVGEAVQVRAEGLFTDYIPQERFHEWMFHIDIDGFTNSWPGLFSKLATGGVVLKIASPRDWTQWYYDRLKPFENFVPVAGDLSDLVQKVKYLAYNLGEAERIGAAGQALARAMTVARECEGALEKMENAVALRRYHLPTP